MRCKEVGKRLRNEPKRTPHPFFEFMFRRNGGNRFVAPSLVDRVNRYRTKLIHDNDVPARRMRGLARTTRKLDSYRGMRRMKSVPYHNMVGDGLERQIDHSHWDSPGGCRVVHLPRWKGTRPSNTSPFYFRAPIICKYRAGSMDVSY